ncbi:MAG: hypothetical protein ACLURI_14380 [Roseburia inulinivorans]
MKKKIVLALSVLALSFVGNNSKQIKAYAQEEGAKEEYSYLLNDEAIIGRTEINPTGVYLMDGMSVIQDAGTGKIVAGGITNAARRCDLTVNVIVERLSGGAWARVTSWTASEDNAWTVGSSKTLSVGRGYYYRVRCIHSAHTDVSSSMTSSLWR